MALILRLPGNAALSPYRIEKIRVEAAQRGIQLGEVATCYWHFLELEADLDEAELGQVSALLDYGIEPVLPISSSPLMLVTPRPGTISPWSSKASDILKNCGINKLQRIERGVAYRLRDKNGGLLADALLEALRPLIHDRMTEVVMDSIEAADTLFKHVPPREVVTIEMVAEGRPALAQVNTTLGLALSDGELDYLLENFTRRRRNPTDVELMMFAQANSEHCRHKIFNASWIIDAETRDKTLFGMIRDTHAAHPDGTLVAYSDNSSVIEGATIERFYPRADGSYGYSIEPTHIPRFRLLPGQPPARGERFATKAPLVPVPNPRRA